MRKVGLFFNLPPMSVDAVFRLCAGIGLLGVLVHATFDYPLEIASLQLYAVFHLAALYQRQPPMPPEKKQPQNDGRPIFPAAEKIPASLPNIDAETMSGTTQGG